METPGNIGCWFPLDMATAPKEMAMSQDLPEPLNNLSPVSDTYLRHGLFRILEKLEEAPTPMVCDHLPQPSTLARRLYCEITHGADHLHMLRLPNGFYRWKCDKCGTVHDA